MALELPGPFVGDDPQLGGRRGGRRWDWVARHRNTGSQRLSHRFDALLIPGEGHAGERSARTLDVAAVRKRYAGYPNSCDYLRLRMQSQIEQLRFTGWHAARRLR
jgi:hypothetical protein